MAEILAPTASNDGGAKVSGIFHAHPVSGIEKEPRYQVERFLHSGNNRDLFGDDFTPRDVAR
jgi:hypothetical protein